MPYFIYRITDFPIRRLEKLEQYESFREASIKVKEMRKALEDGSPAVLKVIHAESEFHAEDLLNQVREASPQLGDD